MRRILLSLATLAGSFAAYAQPQRIWQGIARDSVVISFCDSIPSTNTGISVMLDTSHTSLWRSGSSSKPFFSGTPGRSYGIMTDTATPYPVSQSEWFTLKMSSFSMNPIFSFRHRYQTDSGKDGGIVEYSFDSTAWSNVIGGCFRSVPVDSFYEATDTIAGGIPAFSGSSQWKTSSFQLFRGIPLKGAASCELRFPLWVRWRFSSDGNPESLAGWQIQSIKVESDFYSGSVAGPGESRSLPVSPNPSSDGIFNFPALPGEEMLQLRLTDVTGRTVSTTPYRHRVDLSGLQPGYYFYEAGTFRGQLLRR